MEKEKAHKGKTFTQLPINALEISGSDQIFLKPPPPPPPHISRSYLQPFEKKVMFVYVIAKVMLVYVIAKQDTC